MNYSSKEPVKTVVEYRVHPGREAEFEAWTRAVIDAASRSVGLEGSSVLTSSVRGAYFLLLRFASSEHLARWEALPELAKLEEKAREFTAHGNPQVREGLATWFTLPENRGKGDPPRWKMALVTWAAIYPQIALLWIATHELPIHPLLNQAFTSMICVASLNWAVMPFLTRKLHHWLVAR